MTGSMLDDKHRADFYTVCARALETEAMAMQILGQHTGADAKRMVAHAFRVRAAEVRARIHQTEARQRIKEDRP